MVEDESEEVVSLALGAQREEYETDFQTTNEPLQRIIDEVRPSKQLEIGDRLLASPHGLDRILGARILRENWTRRADALALIVQAVQQESDADVLGWLLSAVAYLGDLSALRVVEVFVEHEEPRVRDQAAGAISSCGAERRSSSAVAALLRLADDSNDEVRFSAVFELGQWWQGGFTDSRVEDRLRRALGEDDGRLRDVAAEAFAAVSPSSS